MHRPGRRAHRRGPDEAGKVVRRLNPERRLANRTVFLSASVPAPNRGFARPPDAAFVVEQAVVGLARAVFAEGGRLVFGAHPSISPLVASVATEYRQASAADGPRPVVIYQSRAFEEVLPNETWDLYRFGFADLLWTDAEGGEHYQPGDAASLQCPLSLRAMRTRMIKEQKPIAMVIAGGMDGVLEESRCFGSMPSDRRSTRLAIPAARLHSSWLKKVRRLDSTLSKTSGCGKAEAWEHGRSCMIRASALCRPGQRSCSGWWPGSVRSPLPNTQISDVARNLAMGKLQSALFRFPAQEHLMKLMLLP